MGPLHETKIRRRIACEQTPRDALEAGRKKEGELATTREKHMKASARHG